MILEARNNNEFTAKTATKGEEKGKQNGTTQRRGEGDRHGKKPRSLGDTRRRKKEK